MVPNFRSELKDECLFVKGSLITVNCYKSEAEINHKLLKMKVR